MNNYLNYLIEVNIGLVLFLACYKLLLKGETNFGMLRIFLLTGVFAALLFPVIHIENNEVASPFSIGQMIPSYWLPEVVIGGDATKEIYGASFNFWKYTTLIYVGGLMLFILILFFQLSQLLRIIHKAKTYRFDKLRIAESQEDQPTFSFFHFIFIGQADRLSASEKQQIIQHESVHAQQWHSFDILLINGLKIFFWFNPFINTYKKIFIQLHEFEADARAVENSDVNKYCSLLAKVALQSADFTLANHFNNSLTVKRIEMMRTIKSNIKEWKVVALIAMLPLLFFFISCQDQVGDDIMEITKNSSHALIVPEFVEQRFAQLKKENPDKNYAVLELNETATEKMRNIESLYGLPRSIEVFKASDGKVLESGIKGEAAGIIVEKSMTGSATDGIQTFAIIEFNAEVTRASEAASEDQIFTVVEEQPEFPGGYEEMMKFIRANLLYPAEARMKGIEGTVYTSFIVETDGSVSSVNTIRGIGEACDNEAKRVIALFPNWIPGKQNGKIVRVRFVMPIRFNLNNK